MLDRLKGKTEVRDMKYKAITSLQNYQIFLECVTRYVRIK